MRRAEKVAAIYLELNAVNDRYSSLQLIEASEALLDLSHPDYIGPAMNDAEYGTSFDRLSLDSAFADGGWKILCRRGHEYCPSNEDEFCDRREPMLGYLI